MIAAMEFQAPEDVTNEDFLACGNAFLEIERLETETYDRLKAILKWALMVLNTSEHKIPRIGPTLGLVCGMFDVGVRTAFWKRWPIQFMAWLVWRFFLRRRPGGNDFLITRWMISRCKKDFDTLTHRCSIPGPIGESAEWALRSLCAQHQEFRDADRWSPDK